MLATLLTQRFGPLPPACFRQLDRASSEQLCALANQLLTAPTLEALFASALDVDC